MLSMFLRLNFCCCQKLNDLIKLYAMHIPIKTGVVLLACLRQLTNKQTMELWLICSLSNHDENVKMAFHMLFQPLS